MYVCFAVRGDSSDKVLSLDSNTERYYLGKHIVIGLPRRNMTTVEIKNYLLSLIPDFSSVYEENLGIVQGITPEDAARAAGAREGFGFLFFD